MKERLRGMNKATSANVDKTDIDSRKQDHKLLVIGAGHGRTGTASLKKALQTLYKRPCYHMTEVIQRGSSEIAKWDALFGRLLLIGNRGDADSSENQFGQEDFASIFSSFVATVDHPANGFVFELSRIYPDAMIILTVRDPQKWLASVRSTIRPRKPRFSPSNWIDRLVERFLLGTNFFTMVDKAFKAGLPIANVDLSDDQQLIDGFNAWNEKVKQLIPSERLLVFDVSQGWEPLCNFLNFQIPKQPFPHVNDQKEIQEKFQALERVRNLTHLTIYSFLVLGLSVLAYWFVSDSFWSAFTNFSR